MVAGRGAVRTPRPEPAGTLRPVAGAQPLVRVEPVAGRTGPTAAMLAASFAEYPATRRLLPDPAVRRRLLRRLLAGSVRDAARHGLALVAVDPAATGPGTGPAVVGALLAMPPGRYPLTLRRRLGKLPAILWAAVAAPRRFPAYLRSTAARKADLPPPDGWWYAHLLGVHPAAGHEPVATALLRDLLARVDRTGLPCHLHTASPAEVEFYRRFGFEVAGPAPPGPDRYVRMTRPGAG